MCGGWVVGECGWLVVVGRWLVTGYGKVGVVGRGGSWKLWVAATVGFAE